jgi:tetratricopeptide (TPR) repeat protein
MKAFLFVSAFAFCAACSFAQAPPPAASPDADVCSRPGFGNVHHAVKTSSPDAQRAFDQGLALDYGFNHGQAIRCFRRASQLDPKMAMAYWGVALASGTNYNLPVDADGEKQAYEAIQKALRLSAGGPANERAYIDALAKRYTNDPAPDYAALEVAYNKAMRQLYKSYPNDLDAATLFAESGMNLHPWQLWNKDGTPAAGTQEIVTVLESVLKRDPNHLGANHYYIHAVEASPHPELGTPSAQRLAGLAPSSGHLVHMPAHIYIRTGDHEDGVTANADAARADEAYFAKAHPQGIYPMMYYTHNLHFLAVEDAFLGRYADALAAAKRTQSNVAPHVQEMAMLDFFNTLPMLVQVRFHRWQEILALPKPDGLAVTQGTWHFARALAYAGTGKLAEAKAEQAELQRLAPEMAKVVSNPNGPHNAEITPQLMSHWVAARIDLAQRQSDAAITELRQAVALEDTLDYNEPPDWLFPLREPLGGALLQAGKAAEAEKVFREDLQRNPRNPRSIFGLAESLQAQGKTADAASERQEFEASWKGADTKLTVASL